MQTSIFIAKLLGPVLAAMGVSMLINRNLVVSLAREAIASDWLIFMSGLLTLPLGLAIVNTHSTWSGWPAIITAFGWIAVAAGFARLLIPGPLKKIGARMIENETLLAVPAVLIGLLGLFLSFKGYGA